VLPSQHDAHVEVYSRTENGRWLYAEAHTSGDVAQPSIEGTLEINRVYRNVMLDPPKALRGVRESA
jgi:hypothetical protein